MSKNFSQTMNKLSIIFFFVLFFVQVQTTAAQQSQSPGQTSVSTANVTDRVGEESDFLSKINEGFDLKLNQNFFINLIINLLGVLIIVYFVYYPNYQKLDTIFTFLMFNIVIYLLTFVLNEVKISMGAAFGLFAVFSMLRYRTTSISIKDMTYLFIFIALGLLSAIQFAYYELVIIVAIIFVAVMVLDTNLVFRKEISATLLFERIEMIKPEMRDALIALLRERLGINIHRVDINEIDFLKDTAIITYYYYAPQKSDLKKNKFLVK